jgi:hypothetical protein
MGGNRFKIFYERYKDTFPYNHVHVTRTSIHSKWLLMESYSPAGIRFHTGTLFAMLSKTMDKKTVQRLIISRQVRPLPDDFCTVMDSMYHWGRTVSPQWYKKTLRLFRYFLWYGHDDFQSGMNLKTYLFGEVIRLRVWERINMLFDGGNAAVYEAWKQHFKERVENGETDFFMLAVSSFQFLSDEISKVEVQTQHNANIPMTIVSNED